MSGLLLYLILSFASFGILLIIVRRAPRGCEDETGYHNCSDCPNADGCK